MLADFNAEAAFNIYWVTIDREINIQVTEVEPFCRVEAYGYFTLFSDAIKILIVFNTVVADLDSLGC